MISRLKTLAAAGFAAAAFALAPAAGANPVIDNAKSQCIVGEQMDGYLGIADEGAATEEVRREVRSVNQQRKAAYEQLAQQEGVTIEVTGQITAETLINRAPSGHCYKDQSGAWQRKP